VQRVQIDQDGVGCQGGEEEALSAEHLDETEYDQNDGGWQEREGAFISEVQAAPDGSAGTLNGLRVFAPLMHAAHLPSSPADGCLRTAVLVRIADALSCQFSLQEVVERRSNGCDGGKAGNFIPGRLDGGAEDVCPQQELQRESQRPAQIEAETFWWERLGATEQHADVAEDRPCNGDDDDQHPDPFDEGRSRLRYHSKYCREIHEGFPVDVELSARVARSRPTTHAAGVGRHRDATGPTICSGDVQAVAPIIPRAAGTGCLQ